MLVAALTLEACMEPARPPELVTEAPYAANTGTLLIHCGSLIDGVSNDIAGPTYVLVEDGRIKFFAVEVEAATRIAQLDLSDRAGRQGQIIKRRPAQGSV